MNRIRTESGRRAGHEAGTPSAGPCGQYHWIINSTGWISGEKTDVAISVLSHGQSSQKGGIDVAEHIAALTRSYLGW